MLLCSVVYYFITTYYFQDLLICAWCMHMQYLSNGRFKKADHRAVVNSNYSRLSVATFQYPATDATVYPLKVREGEKSVMEEPLTFAEIYRRNMSNYLETARIKKAKFEAKPLNEILD